MVKLTKPANKIVVFGEHLGRVEELEVETATNVIPGRLVKRGSSDAQIVVNTDAGVPVGWVGYEQAHKNYRPDNKTTAYAAGAQCPVLKGPGMVIIAHVATGNNVTKGAPLVAAANGEFKLATQLAPPTGTVSVTSTGAQPNAFSRNHSQRMLLLG